MCATKTSPDFFYSDDKIPRPIILDPADPTNNVGKDEGFWQLLTEEAQAWLSSPSLSVSPGPCWNVLVRGFPRWREHPPDTDLRGVSWLPVCDGSNSVTHSARLEAMKVFPHHSGC